MASVKAGKIVGVRQDVSSTCNGSVTLSSPQVTASNLNCGKAGGTGGVYAETGARESEIVTMTWSQQMFTPYCKESHT